MDGCVRGSVAKLITSIASDTEGTFHGPGSLDEAWLEKRKWRQWGS
jgi:hypothetical protein